MKFIICSGEVLTYETYREFNKKYNKIKLYNLYGPTEATIDVTHYTCKQYESHEIIPIGTPIHNTQIHILDEYLNPVPIGTPGEIYIGGAGLARGYLNRASLTAEKFIPNPFTEYQLGDQSTYEDKDVEYQSKHTYEPNYGTRLYKTGDLGRYLEDGNIEFLGRIDHQVKIRGFRIELGEIESTIQSIPGIKQCVVLAREDIENQKRLVGYIVPNDSIVSSDKTYKESQTKPELTSESTAN